MYTIKTMIESADVKWSSELEKMIDRKGVGKKRETIDGLNIDVREAKEGVHVIVSTTK